MGERADPMEKAMAEFRRGQIEATEFYHELPALRSSVLTGGSSSDTFSRGGSTI